jgi:hypothetical protein
MSAMWAGLIFPSIFLVMNLNDFCMWELICSISIGNILGLFSLLVTVYFSFYVSWTPNTHILYLCMLSMSFYTHFFKFSICFILVILTTDWFLLWLKFSSLAWSTIAFTWSLWFLITSPFCYLLNPLFPLFSFIF